MCCKCNSISRTWTPRTHVRNNYTTSQLLLVYHWFKLFNSASQLLWVTAKRVLFTFGRENTFQKFNSKVIIHKVLPYRNFPFLHSKSSIISDGEAIRCNKCLINLQFKSHKDSFFFMTTWKHSCIRNREGRVNYRSCKPARVCMKPCIPFFFIETPDVPSELWLIVSHEKTWTMAG